MPRDDAPSATRPRVGNAHFDAEAMLAKAQRRGYPTAASNKPLRNDPDMTERQAEIAYWRGRCGLPVEADPTDAGDDAPAHAEPDGDDAFLAMSAKARRTLVHAYLLSSYEVDWLRGAHLCELAGLCLPAEAHAAWTAWHERLANWQRRQRLAARASTRAAPVASAMFEEPVA
jgi:hypothetical protein